MTSVLPVAGSDLMRLQGEASGSQVPPPGRTLGGWPCMSWGGDSTKVKLVKAAHGTHVSLWRTSSLCEVLLQHSCLLCSHILPLALVRSVLACKGLTGSAGSKGSHGLLTPELALHLSPHFQGSSQS